MLGHFSKRPFRAACWWKEWWWCWWPKPLVIELSGWWWRGVGCFKAMQGHARIPWGKAVGGVVVALEGWGDKVVDRGRLACVLEEDELLLRASPGAVWLLMVGFYRVGFGSAEDDGGEWYGLFMRSFPQVFGPHERAPKLWVEWQYHTSISPLVRVNLRFEPRNFLISDLIHRKIII